MTQNQPQQGAKLLVAILDKGRALGAAGLCGQCVPHTILPARGTANSELLDYLGLARNAKEVLLVLLAPDAGGTVLQNLAQKLELQRPGHGIALTVPLSGVSSRAMQLAQQGAATTTQTGGQKTMKEKPHYDLVLAVVNEGMTDLAVDAAHAAGARGGTLLHGRSTGDATGFLGVALPPEREVVAIVVQSSQRRAVLGAINQAAGLASPAQGLVFSVPVDEVEGLHEPLLQADT